MTGTLREYGKRLTKRVSEVFTQTCASNWKALFEVNVQGHSKRLRQIFEVSLVSSINA